MERLEEIRQAEAESHAEAYTNHDLFVPGSWLAKPVKTILDLLPLFEVNLLTSEMQHIMEQVFADWQIVKHTVVHQKYDIPRKNGVAELETDVVTYVVRRNG